MLTTFSYKNSSRINPEHLSEVTARLTEYTEHLKNVISSQNYEHPESSINLPSDEELISTVTKMKDNKISSNLRYIIDIGIGGSNLGTKAIYDALYGYYDILQPERFPKIIFLDTTEETLLSPFETLMNSIQNKDEIIINAISKSGGTTESIANLEVVLQFLKQKFPDIHERLVITTDENSKLWQRAKELGIDVLPIPKQVGGRFSVLSSVGLFPLACCGVDISSLLNGAKMMRDRCTTSGVDENPALISAAATFHHLKEGRTITDSFFFAPQLESVGKWYRQLTGESLGKEKDLEGNTVHAGITPTVSIGSTDLHSVGQLYLGGPRDKVTTFIYTTTESTSITVPANLEFPLVEGIQNKKLSDIMKAIREGVKIAYTKQELPFMEVALETINEQSLGEFLQFKMIEMMYLGKLLNVNTFDQPHVELYKTETKEILNH
ncbi:MAG: hypothetical protein ABIO02_04655 [Patescibacteria group bacterium]